MVQKIIGRFARLHVGPVVDVFLDRDPLRQFLHASKVIAVPVLGDEMVDLRQARICHGVDDPSCIARRRHRSHIARVHKQGFMSRRNEQNCVAAFHVDEVNVQLLSGLSRRRPGQD